MFTEHEKQTLWNETYEHRRSFEIIFMFKNKDMVVLIDNNMFKNEDMVVLIDNNFKV